MTNNISHNSIVNIINDNGNKYIQKTFRLGLPRSQAEDIRQQVLLQRENFNNIHVPVSKLIDIDIVEERGEFRLVIKEEYVGSDFMDVVNTENFSMYIDKVLHEILKPLLTSSDKEYLSAGIDGTPRNFVYNHKQNQFCYVDFIPPKVFYKGHYTQEIPEIEDKDFYEIRKTSHNSRAGILYNFYINTIRELPSELGLLAAKLEQFAQELNDDEIFSMIRGSKLYRVYDLVDFSNVVRDIEDWKGDNFFLIREAANWLNNRNPDLNILKKQIYKATSQERDIDSRDYGRISEENFVKAKQLLLHGVELCKSE